MRQEDFNFWVKFIVVASFLSYSFWRYRTKGGRASKLTKLEKSRKRRGIGNEGIPFSDWVWGLYCNLLGIEISDADEGPELSKKKQDKDNADMEEEESDRLMPLKATNKRSVSGSTTGVRNRTGPSRPKVRAKIQQVATLGAASDDPVDIEPDLQESLDDDVDGDFNEIDNKGIVVTEKSIQAPIPKKGRSLLSDSESDSEDDNDDPDVDDDQLADAVADTSSVGHSKVMEKTQTIADVRSQETPDVAAAVTKLSKSMISCDILRIVSKKNKLRIACCLSTEASNTEAVGFAVYRVQQCSAQVLFVGVVESHRRQGIGRDLIRVVRDAAKREPLCLSIVALLEPEVMASLPFWRSNGFKKLKVEDIDQEDEHTCVELEIRKLGKQQKRLMERANVSLTGTAQSLSWPEILIQAKLHAPHDASASHQKRTDGHNSSNSTKQIQSPQDQKRPQGLQAAKKESKADNGSGMQSNIEQHGFIPSHLTLSDTSVLAELPWGSDQLSDEKTDTRLPAELPWSSDQRSDDKRVPTGVVPCDTLISNAAGDQPTPAGMPAIPVVSSARPKVAESSGGGIWRPTMVTSHNSVQNPQPLPRVASEKEREHMASVLTEMLGIPNGTSNSSNADADEARLNQAGALTMMHEDTAASDRRAPEEAPAPVISQRRPPPRQVKTWVPTLRHNAAA
eukprot:gnl/MRDRNA2_/MRDRNA2_98494_c0_seq1.p1 gnl/MRDRNA2_/MRDRNA2_98494_c0~~gnl/MRDRNA2_/MRDRNA2_98494_c0_seq1.p1  ORF type:complete len:680 (-),score=136.07 gnl/MRDRNA2_/MRDRNA2_98494_c0_seq1:54-2093(-)